MHGFLKLPAEVIEHIVSFLDQPELYTILRLSRSLYTLTVPFLYRHVDLYVRSRNLPAIDTFFINVAQDKKLANYIQSLRIGLLPAVTSESLDMILPPMPKPRQTIIWDLAKNILLPLFGRDSAESEELLHETHERSYGAFATLVVLLSKSLRQLHILDHSTRNPIYRVLHRYYEVAESSAVVFPRSLCALNLNSDDKELYYPKTRQALDLKSIAAIQTVRSIALFTPNPPSPVLTDGFIAEHITTMVLRHSRIIPQLLQAILPATCQLRTLACEYFHDSAGVIDRFARHNEIHLDLVAWNQALYRIRDTLQTLVVSVEICDTTIPFWKQPIVREHFTGQLDLAAFEKLETLEIPFPFLTGDPGFLVLADYDLLLPPNLRNLSLRTDMSHAQFPFPYDASANFEEANLNSFVERARFDMDVRMDIAYMYQTSLSILDRLTDLRSFSVWQPMQASLTWFDGQLYDLHVTCKNKSIVGKVIYPQLVRSRKQEQWNLIKEVITFDPNSPDRKNFQHLVRGQREGNIPLGLATQYHSHAIRKGIVDSWSD